MLEEGLNQYDLHRVWLILDKFVEEVHENILALLIDEEIDDVPSDCF